MTLFLLLVGRETIGSKYEPCESGDMSLAIGDSASE